MSHLKIGAKGNGVKNLQKQLIKAGVRPKVTVNGDFDETTDKAVKAFQKKLGMEPDGRVCGNTQFGLRYGTKPIKWTLRDVDRPIQTLVLKRRELHKTRVAVIRVAQQNSKNPDNRKAFAVYDKVANEYSEKLLDFIRQLRKIAGIKRRFDNELKGRLMDQTHALRDATALFKDAEAMNRDAQTLSERHDEEHDRFLDRIQPVAA